MTRKIPPARVQATVRLDPIIAAAVTDRVERDGISFAAAIARMLADHIADGTDGKVNA